MPTILVVPQWMKNLEVYEEIPRKKPLIVEIVSRWESLESVEVINSDHVRPEDF